MILYCTNLFYPLRLTLLFTDPYPFDILKNITLAYMIHKLFSSQGPKKCPLKEKDFGCCHICAHILSL